MFRKTSAISTQVFPITLDIDHPRWMRGLDRLRRSSVAIAEAKRRGGAVGALRRVAGMAGATWGFASLYTIPAVRHEVPASSRMEPAY